MYGHNQLPEGVLKIGVLRNVAKFTWKHLYWSLFLIKLQVSGLQLYLKVTPAQVFFCEFCKNLKVVSATFLLVSFLSVNESTYQTRKSVFYFNSKALSVLEKIKF